MNALPNDISPLFKGCSAAERRVIQRLLKLEATPEAIKEFARCRSQLDDYWYWFTLSTLWVSYTGFSSLELWKRLFSSTRPGRAMSLMKPSEYRALDALPDPLTVFRAHRPGETDWIAYTLNLEIAATRFAVKRGVDEVRAYTVRKQDVLALFLRRGEEEVLVLDKTKVQYSHTIKVERQVLTQ